MSKHLQNDLELLKKEIMNMACMAEQATNKALIALQEYRKDLAEEVIRNDEKMDQKEIQIEEECLKVLALHQPVASDLRFVITLIKVNNDLERIGDLAVNIAERALHIAEYDPLHIHLEFPGMTNAVRLMLKQSLDALSTGDTTLAREVLTMDDQVDDANSRIFETLQNFMRKHPDAIEHAQNLLSASRQLERIGDLATNISEDVVYMVEGEIIRHRFVNFQENK